MSVPLETFTQLPPLVLQRNHWYANDVGELLHVPSLAVSICPTVGVPEIVGGAVFTGAARVAAEPEPAIAM